MVLVAIHVLRTLTAREAGVICLIKPVMRAVIVAVLHVVISLVATRAVTAIMAPSSQNVVYQPAWLAPGALSMLMIRQPVQHKMYQYVVLLVHHVSIYHLVR